MRDGMYCEYFFSSAKILFNDGMFRTYVAHTHTYQFSYFGLAFMESRYNCINELIMNCKRMQTFDLFSFPSHGHFPVSEYEVNVELIYSTIILRIHFWKPSVPQFNLCCIIFSHREHPV